MKSKTKFTLRPKRGKYKPRWETQEKERMIKALTAIVKSHSFRGRKTLDEPIPMTLEKRIESFLDYVKMTKAFHWDSIVTTTKAAFLKKNSVDMLFGSNPI